MCHLRSNIMLFVFLSLISCGDDNKTSLPSSIDIPLITGTKTYQLKNVPGDGNCFYHAIANNPQVHMSHQDLRELAATTFMQLFESNKHRVEGYIIDEKLDPNRDDTKMTIVNKIRQSGNWGGHSESAFLEEALNTPIHIYNHAAKTWTLTRDMKEGDIFILYNGTNHYLALEKSS